MLGPRIAELRHRAGLTQAALANRLNISTSALGMYEQGRRTPSASILVALANELGVTTDALLLPSPVTSKTSCTPPGPSRYSHTLIDILLQTRYPYPYTKQELITLCVALFLDC